jgi:two-component SAPR family response regulator
MTTIKRVRPKARLGAGRNNLALFFSGHRRIWMEVSECLGHLETVGPLFIILARSSHPVSRSFKKKCEGLGDRLVMNYAETLGFLETPASYRVVKERIRAWLAAVVRPNEMPIIAIDMGWGMDTPSATANFERWMQAAGALTDDSTLRIISLYNRSLLIDEHLLAGLRGHPFVLTRSGIVDNPHWLPPELTDRGTRRQQIDHWLSRISPALAHEPERQFNAAEGADPMWLQHRVADRNSAPQPNAGEQWKIRCFGRLRVYRGDGTQVDWALPGGSTLKTKTLFAYLLQKGEQGAELSELADLLWPAAETKEHGRNRLYHTVRSLRVVLSGAADTEKSGTYIARDGSRYVLTAPERSWIDISAFEQFCRQSELHVRSGAPDEALICLQAADRLYSGDIFEDIPEIYADDSDRDWCWSKRRWLRDMVFKVQRDAARIFRQRGDFKQALRYCQRALEIDPVCEIAHEEAMQIYHAQGRRDAIDRQYKLYLASLGHFDERPRSATVRLTYERLIAS